ncbi:hypothetical protein Q9L58_001919 [Maublancomyces gigas]|uniref:Uncharacterized protein n=1 Tax=Discina gigas TaxID=1032678 RepID=A0ABR3GSZ1_9PEZI
MSEFDDPMPRLPEDSTTPYASTTAGGKPHGTRPAEQRGLSRTWFATAADLRPPADSNEVTRGIYRPTPVLIILLLLLGTAAAIGHHLFYSALHNTTVGNETRQRWTLWIGSGLSFLTKVCLTAAIAISRTQWLWLTLWKKWLTLTGIDAIFGVTTNPWHFINPVMLTRAKAVTIMATAMWMIPIAAILTPGTISVGTFPRNQTVPCSVRSLRFPFDSNSTANILAGSDIAKDIPIEVVTRWSDDPFLLHMVPRVSNEVMRLLRLSSFTGFVARPADLPPVGSPITFTGPAINCAIFTPRSTQGWQNGPDFVRGAFYYILSLEEPPCPIVFRCQSSTARYTVVHTIEGRRFLEPVITRVESITLPFFQEIPVYPDPTYLAYEGLPNALLRTLQGHLHTTDGYTAEVALTPVMNDIISNPINVGPAIEKMAHKMIASLLASDIMLNGSVYALDVTAIQHTNCTKTKTIVLYVYAARTLVMVYGLAVACALMMSVAGFFALGKNGVASEENISSIICATRNRTLDDCITGSDTLGANTMSKGLRQVELQFGALRTSEKRTSSFALGVQGEIYPIKRD